MKGLFTIAMIAVMIGSLGTVALASDGSGRGGGEVLAIGSEGSGKLDSLQDKLISLLDKIAMAQAEGDLDKVADLTVKFAETQDEFNEEFNEEFAEMLEDEAEELEDLVEELEEEEDEDED